ncbi:hypothetical protein [Streptomyces sp. NPDC059949]
MLGFERDRNRKRPGSGSSAPGASLVLDAVDKPYPGVQDLVEALEHHVRTDIQANL